MDWQAFRVSLSLGLWTVALLVPVGMWAGHGLATRTFRGKALLEAAVAIPLLLPPTVLGFYLLTVFSPRSAVGAAFERLAGASLAFSFPGLVLASTSGTWRAAWRWARRSAGSSHTSRAARC